MNKSETKKSVLPEPINNSHPPPSYPPPILPSNVSGNVPIMPTNLPVNVPSTTPCPVIITKHSPKHSPSPPSSPKHSPKRSPSPPRKTSPIFRKNCKRCHIIGRDIKGNKWILRNSKK